MAVLALLSLAASPAWSMGKKKPEPPKAMKRAVLVDPIQDRYIELPGTEFTQLSYGANIYERLVDDMQKSGDYAVLVGDETVRPHLELASLAASTVQADPDPCLINTPPVASSELSIRVDELSFATGSRGERMSYGFTRGHENPYNAGVDAVRRNEFPVRLPPNDPSWFEANFDDTGGLHDGLDLGHQINFDVLIVGAKLIHREYHASLGLDIVYRNRFGEPQHRQLTTTGTGFYFDLSAHFNYEGNDFMAGVTAARKAALLDAFNRVIGKAISEIGAEVGKMPLLVKLAARCDGAYYVSAGADYRVPVGQRFYDLTQLNAGRKPAVFTVEEVFQRGSRVRIDGDGFGINDELASLAPGEAVPAPRPRTPALYGAALSAAGSNDPPASPQAADAGNVNVDLPQELGKFVESFFERLWAGLKALVTLPYRIYRFFQYDQDYGGGELWQVEAARAQALAARSWALNSIGLPQAFQRLAAKPNGLGWRGVVVAVLDSGIDYNHDELRRNIFWDGERNTPGWDFISNDPRPYDDHEHGTTVASLIAGGGSKLVGVAPNVTLLPIKAFNPYGLTSSATVYSAFEYAVASGARIIVTGWATPVDSQALKDGVRLADANGVLVVAAAGDDGQDLTSRPVYPAAYSPELKNMVVVAAQDRDGSLSREKGWSSNYGKIADLAAPGVALSVASPRNRYVTRSGSGLAAGLVAGTAALIWSQCPNLSPSGVKTALLAGARPDPGIRGEVPENRSLSVPGALDQLTPICK